MMASLMPLVVSMSLMSCARRLKPKHGSGVDVHPITPPTMQQAPMITAPVVTLQRLQVQPSSFPAVWSNASDIIFPSLGLTANAGDTQISRQAFPPPVTYGTEELDRARLDRARQLVDGLAALNYQQISSTGRPDSRMEPSSTEPGRTVPSTGIKTVNSLTLDSFQGHWHQMYGSSSRANLAFGKNVLTSDYILQADGSIHVVNQGLTPGQQNTKVFGTLNPTDLPGQMKLSFSTFLVAKKKPYVYQIVPIPDWSLKPSPDYWIYKLGPLQDKKYEYAIVGGPLDRTSGRDQTQLSVLARSPKRFDNKYDHEVQAWLTQNGFTVKRFNRECGKSTCFE